jgi:pyrroloquinoline quinone biosynthesis protein B
MLQSMLPTLDHVFIDATFWDDNELLDENGVGRDMSEIPHPRVTETMDMLQHLPPQERAKIHFIHYNHTNPIRDPSSPESHEVSDRGFTVARRAARYCL